MAHPELIPETVFLKPHSLSRLDQIQRYFGRPLLRDLNYLRIVYGLEVGLKGKDPYDHHDARFGGLYLAEAGEAVQVLKEEIRKYPPEYIKEMGIPRLRTVVNLKIPSRGSKPRLVDCSGMVIMETRQLYWSPDFRDEPFSRKSIHHELEHDREASDVFFGRKTSCYDAWSKFHEGDKDVYIGGASYDDMSNEDLKALDSIGFARVYGRVDEGEDRATIAELLMTDPVGAFNRVSKDSLLNAKIEYLKADYYLRSRGRMNDWYFEDLAEGRIGEGYWETDHMRRLFISCWSEIGFRLGILNNLVSHPSGQPSVM